MTEDCIFCRIVAGEVPSYTVDEDGAAKAFLDVNPLARGHTVVIPKEHHGRLSELPEELARDVFATIHRVASVMEEAVDADGVNVGFNDGEAAGQEVPHVHGHVIPRWAGDGGRPVHAVASGRQDVPDAEMEAVAERIADRL